jgi:DNA-binding transcriptional MerR regulator
MATASIPHRAVYRPQDVCEIAQVQPYVLRSWEAEFPDLGVSKSADGPRLYRRADLELVLRLKDLLFVDGLTLAGARKRLIEEGATAPPASDDAETITDEDVAAFVDKQTLKSLHDVRQGLGWILNVLDGGKANGAVATTRPARFPSASKAGRLKVKPMRAVKAKPAKARGKSKPAARPAGRKKR